MRPSPLMDEDTQLMTQAAQGDMAAFERLVSRHQKSVLNTINRFIGDRTEAEDLTQEVFLNVFKASRRYKPDAKFSTWLRRIVTNACLNYYRGQRRHPTISLDAKRRDTDSELGFEIPSPASGQPDAQLESAERARLVREAIDLLPEKQRMAVILLRFEGLSYKEIAESLECSVSAVESMLFRAKQSLKEKLEPLMRE